MHLSGQSHSHGGRLLDAENYAALHTSLIRDDDEADVLNFDSNAFVITGKSAADCETPLEVTFITLRNPVRSFEKKKIFKYTDNCFKPVKDKYLDLPMRFDVIIINETIYMLSLIGETLFDLERTYKKLCVVHTEEILAAKIVCDAEIFGSIAASGHNPRRFLTFSKTRLQYIAIKKNRSSIGSKFRIPIAADGTFDIADPKNSERLIKFLCEKAMEDPVDHSAKEVPAARAWT